MTSPGHPPPPEDTDEATLRGSEPTDASYDPNHFGSIRFTSRFFRKVLTATLPELPEKDRYKGVGTNTNPPGAVSASEPSSERSPQDVTTSTALPRRAGGGDRASAQGIAHTQEGRASRRPQLGAAFVGAGVAVAVAGIVWLLARGEGESSAAAAGAVVSGSVQAPSIQDSEGELRAAPRAPAVASDLAPSAVVAVEPPSALPTHSERLSSESSQNSLPPKAQSSVDRRTTSTSASQSVASRHQANPAAPLSQDPPTQSGSMFDRGLAPPKPNPSKSVSAQ